MTNLMRTVAATLMCAFVITACKDTAKTPEPPINLAHFDTTCAPCKDFYQYANGGWLKKAVIPASLPETGAFQELQDRNEDLLHTILDRDAAGARAGKLTAGTPAWKIGTYYSTCLDTAAIDKLGATPLKSEFDAIESIKTVGDLTRSLGTLEHDAGLAPWTDGSVQDFKDTKSVIAVLYQGGFTLPDRDYYTRTDSTSQKMRDEFGAHMTRMFQLLGDAPDKAAAESRTVLAIETRFARLSKSPADLRDPQANYHRMTVAQMNALTPHLAWDSFFVAQSAPPVSAIDVGQPEFFKGVDAMLTSVPIADWKVLLRWHALHDAARSLSTPFVKENFTYAQLFSGAKELLPRWKRCEQATDDQLGELLGQEYVKDNFTPEAKARAVKIVGTLVDELHNRIEHLDWMSAPTKVQALAKLTAFTKKIGYPDKWRDYSKLDVTPGQHFANVRAATRWATARDWAKIGKPVDRTEWTMTPPTVNAYYNPLLNEIVFPAGILQPPFYNPAADDAVNYGSMGAVIGHEMTHGFDDQGRQFDKDGNLRDWWTKADADKYNAEAAKVVKQYDAYTVVDSATHVNGKLTLGENIGDFGGLTVAYSAMEKALGNGPRTKIDGFTPEQRFFLAYAEIWRSIERPELLRSQVHSNEHSPSNWRVDGSLSNMPEFKQAWGCKDGDAMVRADSLRPRIW